MPKAYCVAVAICYKIDKPSKFSQTINCSSSLSVAFYVNKVKLLKKRKESC